MKNKKTKVIILVILTLVAVISICLFVYITTIMYKKDGNVDENLNATKEGNYKKLVKDYYCGWDPEEVLGIFYAVYTNEEQISGSNFNLVWKDYLNKYSDIDKYRIGYNLKFTMNDGTVIDQTILNPDHAYLMYPEIQCYLYDDINLVPGKRYYHITSEEMNDNTICSSIKLVGDKKTPNISSEIELTAFTYKSNDDFDANGKYRGNSKYTVTIYRKK